MIRRFIKKIALISSTLFWADFSGAWRNIRKYWPQFLVCFFAIQQTACTYGTPCDEDECPEVDRTLDCVPILDSDAMTGNEYTECEQVILDTIKSRRALYINEYGVCTSAEPRCNLNHDEGVLARETCPMDHIKADGALMGYSCNHEIVSIEEGERRLNQSK